MIMIKL